MLEPVSISLCFGTFKLVDRIKNEDKLQMKRVELKRMIKWLPALRREINYSINLSSGQKRMAIEIDNKLVDVVV